MLGINGNLCSVAHIDVRALGHCSAVQVSQRPLTLARACPLPQQALIPVLALAQLPDFLTQFVCCGLLTLSRFRVRSVQVVQILLNMGIKTLQRLRRFTFAQVLRWLLPALN